MMMDGDLTADIEVTRQQNRNFLLAEGFKRIVAKSNALPLCMRYSAQTERHHRRAVEEFDRLKALRPKTPNEPIIEPEPEQTAPAAALDETNPNLPENPQNAGIAPTADPQPVANPATFPGAREDGEGASLEQPDCRCRPDSSTQRPKPLS